MSNHSPWRGAGTSWDHGLRSACRSVRAWHQDRGQRPICWDYALATENLVWGDPDGTFHDFGSYYYVVRALPANTNQFTQTIAYNTGRAWGVEDRIPSQIYFDMYKKPAEQPPVYGGAPYPYYGPPYAPYYYGPRVIITPGYHRRWWW